MDGWIRTASQSRSAAALLFLSHRRLLAEHARRSIFHAVASISLCGGVCGAPCSCSSSRCCGCCRLEWPAGISRTCVAWEVAGLRWRLTHSEMAGTALEDLYNSTNGIDWTHSQNWLVGDPCDNLWYGVYCSESGSVVSMYVVQQQSCVSRCRSDARCRSEQQHGQQQPEWLHPCDHRSAAGPRILVRRPCCGGGRDVSQAAMAAPRAGSSNPTC